MKKTIYAILVLCLLLMFGACNKNPEENSGKKNCKHTYTESITEEASCTQVGIKTFTCSQCGDSYTEEIAMLAHSFGNAVIMKRATCTETGEKSKECTICGKTEVTEIIEKVEHQYTYEVTTAATCAEEGVKSFTCSICNDTYTENIAKLSHSYNSEVTTAATCTKAGTKTFTCSGCGDKKTEAIAALGHVAVKDPAIAGTCQTVGKTEGSHCSRCNEILVAQKITLETEHNVRYGICEDCNEVVDSDKAVSRYLDVNAQSSIYRNCNMTYNWAEYYVTVYDISAFYVKAGDGKIFLNVDVTYRCQEMDTGPYYQGSGFLSYEVVNSYGQIVGDGTMMIDYQYGTITFTEKFSTIEDASYTVRIYDYY